ncbi:MAG: hypothetical protein IJ228_00985 [Succinivibrio sp.]|nr:hypothetical protein [Succinivibrio sp.]
MLDIDPITIGDHVMIGPNASIITVGHPLSPQGRRRHWGQAHEVSIGNDVWIGACAVSCQGLPLAPIWRWPPGAVVTHDVPDNSVVGGVPARLIKEIENDVQD